jgi:hypothetical protein
MPEISMVNFIEEHEKFARSKVKDSIDEHLGQKSPVDELVETLRVEFSRAQAHQTVLIESARRRRIAILIVILALLVGGAAIAAVVEVTLRHAH